MKTKWNKDELRLRLRLRLRELWRRHDQLERQIILIERKFTDKELRRMGAAGG